MKKYSLKLIAILLYCLLLAALCSCEKGVTLRGTITVASEIQQKFSSQKPGRLILRATIPKTSLIVYSLGVLCEPGDRDLVVRYYHDGFGCAKRGTLEAWIEPIDPNTEDSNCGIVTTSLFSISERSNRVAEDKKIIFPDNTGQYGCSNGEADVDLVLKLTK